MTDITLEIVLKGDGSGLVGEIGRSSEALQQFGDDAKETGRDFSGLGESMVRSLGEGGALLQEIGRSLRESITLPIVNVGISALKTASEVEAANANFDAAFDDQADTVREWADQTGISLNRSTFALQGYAASLQGTFVPLGIARDEAAEMSKQVTQLAIDLASFNNKSEPETVEALTAALTGNDDAAQQLGVVINQAALEQELLNQGIEGGIAAATEQDLVMARLATIMEQTSEAQGDAAKTADLFVNRMQGLEAATDLLLVAVGSQLLPIAGDLVQILTDAAIAFSELDPAIHQTSAIIAAVFAVGGPALIALGTLAAAISAIGLPVAGVIAAITALSAAWVIFGDDIVAGATRVQETIQATIDKWLSFGAEVKEIVKNTIAEIEEAFVRRLNEAFALVGKRVDDVTGFFRDMWEKVVGNSFVPDMVDEIQRQFERLGEIMLLPAQDVTAGIKDAFASVSDESKQLFENMIDDLIAGEASWRDFGKVIISVVRDILEAQTGNQGIFKGSIGSIFSNLLDFVLQPSPIPIPKPRPSLPGSPVPPGVEFAIAGASLAPQAIASDSAIPLAGLGGGGLAGASFQNGRTDGPQVVVNVEGGPADVETRRGPNGVEFVRVLIDQALEEKRGRLREDAVEAVVNARFRDPALFSTGA